MTNVHSDTLTDVQEAAASWFLRQQEELTAAQQAAFEHWLNASPSHAREYEAFCRLWCVLDHAHATPHRPGSLTMLLTTLASVVVVVTTLLYLPQQQVVSTAYGETRTMRLRDGSELTLGGNTQLQVTSTWRSRQVMLTQGIARFHVAPNPRPFAVVAANGVIRDIGTTFDVVHNAKQVRVTVLEGQIGLSLAGDNTVYQAGAGHEIRYMSSGIKEQRMLPASEALNWQDTVWTFQNVRLSDLIEEANRQSHRSIRMVDPAMGQILLSGSLRRNDTTALLTMLTTMLPLRVIDHSDGTFLLENKKKHNAMSG